MRPQTKDQMAAKYYTHMDIVPGAWLKPLTLPELRAYWANAFNKDADWHDRVGNNDLTATGVTVADIGCSTAWPAALVPYIELDGTNDHFAVADNAALSITGDLSILGWVYPDTIGNANNKGVVNKYLTTDDKRSYSLYLDTSDQFTLAVSSDGTAGNEQTVSSAAVTAAAVWYFVCARFDAGTSMSVRVNDGAWVTETSSVPASIHDSARNLYVGLYNETASGRWDGRYSWLVLEAYHVTDEMIDALYKAQAPLFGRAW